MKEEEQRLYEGMYILRPSLSEEGQKKALERIKQPIEASGGVVHKVHHLGRKKLAYEINGVRQGHYFVLYFSVLPKQLTEMHSEYKLNEDLVRCMTLAAERVVEKIEFKPLLEEKK